MSVEIRWKEPSYFDPKTTLVRHIVEPPKSLRCPSCHAVIYSRRHKLCGVCSEELPKELLFSEAQALRVEGLLQMERQMHRAWMKRE